MADETLETFELEAQVEVRSASKRELEVRLVPWDTVIETTIGPEMFRRGATADTPDDGLVLMGLEHEASFGIGQTGEPRMVRHPVGRSTRVWETDDGGRAIIKVGRTQKGDELLALAEDGIVRGISVEFSQVPGGTSVETRAGRRVRVHNRVNLTGASMVTRPAYGDQATILAVRSEETNVSEETVTPAEAPAAPVLDLEPYTRSVEASFGSLAERIAKVEEQSRSAFVIPAAGQKHDDRTVGRWVKNALAALTGDRISDAETRAWEDLVTTDNLGVVPEAFLPDLIGIINANRPFLGSTRRINTPAAGMTLNVPVITTRPTAGVQVNEKDPITSTPTSITSTGFDAVTIAGGGDISVQLLRRSDPSYLQLFLELMAEQLSKVAETEAITTLLASGVSVGTGTLDPDDLAIGEAWANAAAVGLLPDTIWLSSDAMVKFIDAKAAGTNAPLYSNLAANFTVAGGAGGTISGLRPVFVPALDGSGSDVVVGPSRGFAWAEDGSFTLQVDVPSKAGRDVALVTIDWFMPLYPDAFTEWSV